MNERERLFERVAQGPKSVRYETLVQLMELWGFKVRLGKKGDNILFQHETYAIKQAAAKPHHGPVLPFYVRDCLKAIEEVQLREEATDA